jgi:NhaP-type Na+/H+ or K+/H+ antiporter
MRLVRFFRFLMILLIPRYVFTYLDPGSGSFILQLIIGAIAGLLIALKAYWGRIKSFFMREDVQRVEEGQSSTQKPG